MLKEFDGNLNFKTGVRFFCSTLLNSYLGQIVPSVCPFETVSLFLNLSLSQRDNFAVSMCSWLGNIFVTFIAKKDTGYIHVLLVMILYRDMASRVALVMSPLVPRICRGVGNMGLKTGGGVQGGTIDFLSILFP